MTDKGFSDEAIILKVKNWQTADKYAVCFSRTHGKVTFLAYGARYARTNGGRLIQPFAVLDINFFAGKKLDTLKSCELISYPAQFNLQQMAYAGLIAEVTEHLSEEHQQQEEVYELLLETREVLMQRNPRLVALSFIVKLLFLTGILPQYQTCVNCGKPADGDAHFSVVQGGLICGDCHGGEELPFSREAQEFLTELLTLDFKNPQPFKVRGGTLMELEKILQRFIVYQTDKPLKSLDFLSQTGV